MSRVRVLGVLGMIGGVIYMMGGVRMLAFGYGEDRLTDVMGILWALCWVGAGSGLLQLRVAGPSRFGRAVSILLIAGFVAAVLWGIHRWVDPGGADRGPFAVAPMLVILGMLGTGILALTHAPWRGWRRLVPLLIALIYIGTIVVSGVTGASTLPYAFTLAGLGYVLLGDTIRGHRYGSADAGVFPTAAGLVSR